MSSTNCKNSKNLGCDCLRSIDLKCVCNTDHLGDQAINPEKMKLIAVNIPNVTELNVGTAFANQATINLGWKVLRSLHRI